MSLLLRGRIWWCEFYVNKKRIQRPLYTQDRAVALQRQDALRKAARSTETYRPHLITEARKMNALLEALLESKHLTLTDHKLIGQARRLLKNMDTIIQIEESE